MPRPSDDDRFAERLSAGDPQAVEELHHAFSRRVYLIALREMRSPADAEDVRNETLMRVAEGVKAGRLTTPAALPGFVSGTTRNVIREFRRRQSRATSIEGMEFAAPATTSLVDHTVRRVMQEVFRRLRPRERDFLRMYYYDEMSKEEISRKLDIHEDRLRLIKSRALKSFRELYVQF